MKFKLLLLLLLTIPCLLLTAPTVHAQADQNNTYNNTNPDVPHNLNTYTQNVFIQIAATISCQLSGFDPTNTNGKCLGVDPVTKKIGYVEGGGGAIGIAGNFIAATFTIPINTHQYASYLASNFGAAKSVYAQEDGGLGYNSLLPTLKLWKAFRNVTYMIFVILFIIVGLGIMFRIKIDPRTVMTIQNQIPKIIVGLVLVTFSYALAGLLIDIMYVMTYLIISAFAGQGYDVGGAVAANPFGAIGGLGGMGHIANGVAFGTMSGVAKELFSGTLGTIVGAMIGALIGKMMGGTVGGFFGPAGNFISNLVGVGGGAILGGFFGNKLVGLVAGILTYIIIIIALFSALLRLWFVLIKAYINILISVVFAPFYIAYGLIPGKSGLGSWIKGMVANLSVFPATITMFLLGKAFIDGFSTGPIGTHPFVPPLIGNYADPSSMASIIGLAIILMTPEVANIARDTLKAPDLKYTASIGKSLGTGAGVLGAPISTIGKKVWGVDPYNKQPRPLTQLLQRKFGEGGNALNKLVRFGLGTGHYFDSAQGIADRKEREAKAQQKKAGGTPGGARGGISRILRRNNGGQNNGQTGPASPNGPTTPQGPNTPHSPSSAPNASQTQPPIQPSTHAEEDKKEEGPAPEEIPHAAGAGDAQSGEKVSEDIEAKLAQLDEKMNELKAQGKENTIDGAETAQQIRELKNRNKT